VRLVRHAVVVAALTLCACESAPKVQRVDAEPANCEFLADLYIDQLGDQPAGDAAVKDLKRQTVARGGNTLQCCEMEPEETVLCCPTSRAAANYTGSHRHVARAYRCPEALDGAVAVP
jgi:hypothetical protein